jgi:hypothetical protein
MARMKTTSLANERIKNIFNESVEDIRNNKRPSVSGKMLKKGYSPSSARALTITKTRTWQQLLAQIQDEPLLNKLENIALDDDKRSAIAAIQEIFKLKNKYPEGTSKIVGLFTKIESICDEEPPALIGNYRSIKEKENFDKGIS